MEWPYTYHSKGRPKRHRFRVHLWSLTLLALLLQFLDSSVKGESSPPVADVEDLFKDEGFLRMSRGGEAFGKRPPPPPLLINPPHLSTPPPSRHPTLPTHQKERLKPISSPLPHRNIGEGNEGSKDNGNNNMGSRSSQGVDSEDRAGRGSSGSQDGIKPLEKDMSAVFSKVNSGVGGSEVSGTGESGPDTDSHPLLGITPAAPGDPFDFNPILSNPAVTRILAGSSGRIPQWEPALPDLHDLIPEVNYTAEGNNNRAYGTSYHNTQTSNNPGSPGNGNGPGVPHNPKNPLFVPSPVSSRGSSTMYNMDQMTNNIAIPKHTLPNPSNLATSRSTLPDDPEDGDSHSSHPNGSGRDTYHDTRYSSNGGSHLDDNNRKDGISSNEEEEAEVNDNSSKNYLSSNGGELQGKRGIWKETGQNGLDHLEPRDDNGPKYIVCDALCGAWKHQCKLMGILFSITSVLCLVFAFVVLYSLHFGLRDFLPVSIIFMLLFTTSSTRAFILLSGWYCSPDSRPEWLPILSTLPSALFGLTILVALHLARFPFPFLKSYAISYRIMLLLSLIVLLPPLGLSIASSLHQPNHAALSLTAWITGHAVLALIAVAYLLKFKQFYSRLSADRGPGNLSNGASNPYSLGHGGSTCASTGSFGTGNNNTGIKKRGLIVKWGCLQARAMFGASLLTLSLCIIIIISVSMGRGECETTSSWTGWVLSLCARMLEFAIVIVLLLITVSSADVRLLRLTRVQHNKSNVGLMNADLFPTMVSSNAAVQRCIPMYSSNARTDVMMLGPTENRSSLRGKTFGERALPGERVGEYRSSMGRGLPLRLGNGPSHSMPGTPVDGFPQGMRLPEPAPASLLVTKVVFGTPAVSREVNLNHQHENPLLCTGGPGSKDDKETSNIYASLESVKVASMTNPDSSTGSNHSGSDRVLLSAPRDYVYSISRDLTKTIDTIYDVSRPRSTIQHNMEGLGPPLAHTIEQIGSIPNLNGLNQRPGHFNFHPQTLQHNGNMNPGRAELARTIDRIRYAGTAASSPTSSHVNGRNFVLQLGNPSQVPGAGNPPPYCSSESSHDVTPDSGIVSDTGRGDIPEIVYSRDCRKTSVDDMRRLPLLPSGKQRTPSSTPLYDRTPTSPNNPTTSSPGIYHSGSPAYITSGAPNPSIVGRVEHLLNQTEHILSRTESLDSNSHSAGLQRLLSHKEQLEHVEKLLAQAEYAIWVEKRNCAQQVSQLSPSDSHQSHPNSYGYSRGPILNNIQNPVTSLYNSASSPHSVEHSVSANVHSMSNNKNTIANNVNNSADHISSTRTHHAKKLSKNLEEESVV